ncbi:2Fe-2S iron-sulfur cluster-binding protein [Turneriella parva]|uniref:NADH dehydrogenase subunit G n=1 Tax=Turneriella parva (strain ATCC BAA-1111 / DSM 21527 / NCTC 11395 / H) TaxID=869212 RepID=I4B0E3_TURPD|nr:2Fe-2S iron-sulfur cluster-binding protein [Turneriella parva]AFM10750.1 NADH dehydrogenase subunit G [Turneriella parva DSM 21527]
MAKIFVDGTEFEVDEKKNLIDALKEKGVEIPHFCYHSKLSVVGMCRICLIEIEGVPKFQAACNTPIKDGMKINAFGEKIVKAREGVMEFLLINHPLDCPVCDKAGECRLQNYSFALGHETTRYKEEKRNIPQEKIGTNLLINHNRCILCYRCVRFDREIVGVNDLEMLARGNDTIIAYTPPETSGEKSTYLNHNYQGALADICPVGALLNENTLFQSRVWWYESQESHCHGCSTLCKVSTNVKNNSLYRYMPTAAAPQSGEISDGIFICDYGRFSGKHFSTDRLHHYVATGAQATSKQVLPDLAEKIAAARSILVLGGATECTDDVDSVAAAIGEWRAAGKQVKWDFRSTAAAFENRAGYDFLLSGDLRPNAKYLRDKGATELTNFVALQSEIRNVDLVIVINELSAPYAYQIAGADEHSAHVAGLEIAAAVEETQLFKTIEGEAAWVKTAVFTTHHNSAALRAALAVPVLAFPEHEGRYVDKNGVTKTTTAVLKPVQGLQSVGQVLSRLKTPVGATV